MVLKEARLKKNVWSQGQFTLLQILAGKEKRALVRVFLISGTDGEKSILF